ncbi:MAG: phosphoribosylformylglycinamidine synthase [Clostridia bacterium]|nr:phosphoribosylformylglycinamidine synthase [Clostridia bacterium]
MLRIFVEKKPGFDVEARGLLSDLRENLGMDNLTGVRIVNRYDIEGITEEEYKAAKPLVFSEPPVDFAYDETLAVADDETVIATEYLPGQYDQRADSAAVCVQILTQGEKPTVRVAKLVILKGAVTPEDKEKVTKYYVNPVDSRVAKLEKPASLVEETVVPEDVKTVTGFIEADDEALSLLAKEMGFAMDMGDLKFCQAYFRDEEKRDPSFTEMRVIDTYWSDHCRHTTFSTIIDSVDIEDGFTALKKAYDAYLDSRARLYIGKKKNLCLMDMATIAVKDLKSKGLLKEIDESEEINACSIVIEVDNDGVNEEWLLMFKNETHNHPTEIEPFGGAATCLGGAIRDPLSGRSYVYQAMRVTGASDPNVPINETLPGKLPQKKLTRTAAAGYSSYGNQIGLATGQVSEIYHPGYVAKRMEIGAVIGAAPKSNVVREVPTAGDVIILLGGKTGRDGCGGATGSSKAHTESSIETCGAEVQKGNPPEERKIQRLFRNPNLTTMIKRCNDFGAGGVSVAIGELSDGLIINLDAVPKKYDGLDGTELAISESQERMAVVVAPENVEKFMAFAAEENLESTRVATVTDDNRLTMNWRGKTIVSISRDFLNTNGAEKHATVKVAKPCGNIFEKKNVTDIKSEWIKTVSDLNVCSQKGLVERFDSSIGAATVLMPFGGKTQLTPVDGMAAKIPVMSGKTTTASLMAYGFNPDISTFSPFHGALYAVVESVAKIVALGGDYKTCYLTFQEYFERLKDVPSRWGKPFAALLGAYTAQMKLGLGAIGGKDSMSGSFDDLDVPPTLVSFAVTTEKTDNIISPEFKKAGNNLVLVTLPIDDEMVCDWDTLDKNYTAIHKAIVDKKVVSASVLKKGGVCEAVSKMAFGNMIGADLSCDASLLFSLLPGALLLECEDVSALDGIDYTVIGKTTDSETITVNGVEMSLSEVLSAWTKTLEKTFPTQAKEETTPIVDYTYDKRNIYVAKNKVAKPKVFIPVFPGTNCEYDSARNFINAGAEADICVFRNLTMNDVTESLKEFAKRINESQIIMFPGGFSGGDEPDGSGKFIATAFRNTWVKEATMKLLKERDGLILGICNGFQALIKLGLVPYGEICDMTDDSATLTFNNIGRHASNMSYTKVVSTLSPWFNGANVGDVHAIPISHGEGRFVAPEALLKKLVENGQVATRYVDLNGNPTHDIAFNPNGSFDAIEGITSPDGRVLGKMAHSERKGDAVSKNIPFSKDQKIFESGVNYFK